MKRALGFLLTLVMLAGLCTVPAYAAEPIEFMTGTAIDTALYRSYQDMTAAFAAANPDLPAIELVPSSTDHEGEVKTRLGGGNIPDMWMTHGWSLGRYSEYLLDLSSEEWAANISPLLDAVMRGANGEVYAFPLNVDIAGILYNGDVMAAAGYAPEDIKTWDDFIACCEKIKANGIVPIYNAGKDRWPTGLFVDWIAPGCFTQDELNGMLEGTFAKDSYKKVLDTVNTLTEKAFFNPDYSSATSDDMARALAQGEAGFGIIMNFALVTAFEYVPDANLGFMQIPAFTADASPYYVVGEKDAIGIAKDGKNIDVCKKFLTFLAQPENIAALATSSGQMCGLTTAASELGALAPSMEKASQYPGQPYFDRVYMPSGSWDAIVSTTEMIVTGQKTVDEALAQIESEYAALKK
ncbi:MAG: ABC transporter substrate-binding protein [Clostridia bacterium]